MKLNLCYWLFISAAIILNACAEKSETTVETESSELKKMLVNSDTLHYLDIGQGETVVFVHGTLGNYLDWGYQLDTFASEFRVISYSRRHANPNRQDVVEGEDYSVEGHAADLVQFLRSLNAGPVHLVGHSYGAYTALMAALQHPDLVKSLTLGEPPVFPILQLLPGGDSIISHFNKKALLPAQEAFRNGNDEKGIALFSGFVMGDTAFYSMIPDQDREHMKMNVTELKGIVLSGSQFPEVTCEQLSNLKMPVLLVSGEYSTPMFSLTMAELARCIPGAEKQMIPGASHGLQVENPNVFNASVMTFLKKR